MICILTSILHAVRGETSMMTGLAAGPGAVAMRPQHKGQIETLFRSLDVRHVATGCPRNCESLVDQLALRAALGSRRTHVRDRHVLHAMTTRMLRIGRAAQRVGRIVGPRECLPVSLELPGWFLTQPLTAIAGLEHALTGIPYTGMVERGERVTAALRTRIARQPVLRDPVAFVTAMAGLTCRSRPADGMTIKQAWEPISRHCLETVLANLPPGTEEEGMAILVQSQTSSPGLARLLARTVWLTGMRAREVFGCRLFWTGAAAESAAGLVLGDGQRSGEFPALSLADPMRSLMQVRQEIATRLPDQVAVLTIRTAKTRCGARTINNRRRIQCLAGIDPDDLLRVWMTAQLRTLNLTRTRMNSHQHYCSKRLGRASEAVLPDRVHRINLKLLRHAFIDTCRRTLPLHAVAALSGHTHIVTARHYGGKHARYSRHRVATRWMPQPDPEAVRQIRQIWAAGPEPERAMPPPVPSPEPCRVPA